MFALGTTVGSAYIRSLEATINQQREIIKDLEKDKSWLREMYEAAREALPPNPYIDPEYAAKLEPTAGLITPSQRRRELFRRLNAQLKEKKRNAESEQERSE
jgi:hypothetical protein